MAKLYFRYGCMGSSKTAECLMVKYNYEERGKKTALFKPALDNRDGETIVKSRIGLQSECILIPSSCDFVHEGITHHIKDDIDAILIDEAQFLTKEQVKAFALISDLQDIPVICYGLRTDFQGNLFPGSEALMALADTIEEIKTVCWCGKKATNNARFNEDGIIRDGDQVLCGGNDSYIAVCRRHFRKGNLFGEGQYKPI